MKKVYELSILAGCQILVLIAAETGQLHTFATPKLRPVIDTKQGKLLIHKCLTTDPYAPDNTEAEDSNTAAQRPNQKLPSISPVSSSNGKQPRQNICDTSSAPTSTARDSAVDDLDFQNLTEIWDSSLFQNTEARFSCTDQSHQFSKDQKHWDSGFLINNK
eukprot:TRINITY_DN16049_c0_g1_i1.p1 TRINITY_DN16049_c0_g1~~TRINITY_DN16049_c0_g1_i1.p1  ORF type:complete len:161 (+),score=23.94 TRINITY_DN16049_c0_g1_i1:369-851(+)